MAVGGLWKAERRKTGVAVHAGLSRAQRARLFLVAALVEQALARSRVDWQLVVHPMPPTLELWVPSHDRAEILEAKAVVTAALRALL